MAEQSPSMPRVGLDWTLAAHTGWGIYGVNLALQARKAGILAVPLTPAMWRTLHPLHRAALAASESALNQIIQAVNDSGQRNFRIDFPVVHACNGDFLSNPLPIDLKASRHISLFVSEISTILPEALERSRRFDRFVTCSNWNVATLRAHGFQNVSLMYQGFDPALFHPAPRAGILGNFFTIFSGGKLEYRKGQDIVIAALRQFQQRHPDTLLVFAWENAWPETVAEISAAGLVEDAPQILPDKKIAFVPWLKKMGLTNVINLGGLMNWQMPLILREMDVALLPSRCEGATNFVAMECIACGLPTILSANTGHLDLIDPEGCYPLTRQGPVKPTPTHRYVDQWGESSVDEILENLERIYADRAESRCRGLHGAQSIQKMSWENQFPRLAEHFA